MEKIYIDSTKRSEDAIIRDALEWASAIKGGDRDDILRDVILSVYATSGTLNPTSAATQ